jgi:hypothetical protein
MCAVGGMVMRVRVEVRGLEFKSLSPTGYLTGTKYRNFLSRLKIEIFSLDSLVTVATTDTRGITTSVKDHFSRVLKHTHVLKK